MAAEVENLLPEIDDKNDESYGYDSNENIYEVEKILGVTKHEGKHLYRVRWQGYGPDEDTWEPRENLLTCEDLVEEFIEKEKLRKQKINQNLTRKDKKPSKKRTSPKEAAIDAQPKRRRSFEKEGSHDEPSRAKKKSPISSEDEGPPPLKDPFWDNLEKGLITFDGDMYSKVKSRRATLDAKKERLSHQRLQEKAAFRERSRGSRKGEAEEATSDQDDGENTAESQLMGSKEETRCLGEGSILSEDMYSKVKSRRAYLDAKKHEAAKEEAAKKDKSRHHRHHRHHSHHSHHHYHKKSKKDGSRKPKSLIDLEAIGSLETATQKTLSMSPSILEREMNAANLFHTPDSYLPMEEVLTVAKLEEKTYGRQLSNQSEAENEEEKIPGRLTSLSEPAYTASAEEVEPKPSSFQRACTSTSQTAQEHSPSVPATSIPDTPESPDATQKGPSMWKPWEQLSHSSLNSDSNCGSTTVSMSSLEFPANDQVTSGCPASQDDVQGLGQDLAAIVSIESGNESATSFPQSTTEIPVTPVPSHSTANSSGSKSTISVTDANQKPNAAPGSTFDTLPTPDVPSAPVFDPTKAGSQKPGDHHPTPVDIVDKVPVWLELQNFVDKDPFLQGSGTSKRSSESVASSTQDPASSVLLSPVSESARDAFDSLQHQKPVTKCGAEEKPHQLPHEKMDSKSTKDNTQKKHHRHSSCHSKTSSKQPDLSRKTAPSLEKTSPGNTEKKVKNSDVIKKGKGEKKIPKKKHAVKEATSNDRSALLNEPSLQLDIQELLAQSCSNKEGNLEFDFDEDVTAEDPWTKPGLSPIILSDDALKQVVKEGQTERVREALWLNGTHDLEQQDPLCGSTLLMHACINRHDEIAKLLIAHGALVNVQQGKSGMTPLMYASEMGFYNMVAILLEAGAHVNLQQDVTGETAMMKACKRGHAQIVNLLLMFGGNWAIITPTSKTAVDFAFLYNQPDAYDALTNHINRVVTHFEGTINQYLCGTAKLMKPVFPLQCFRIRESTEHNIYLNYDTRQYAHNQGCGNVLFVGHASISLNSVTCRLTGPSFVYKVTLNGQDLPQLSQVQTITLHQAME